MKRLSTIAMVCAAILYAGSALAQTPNPSQVYIKRVTYAGPGCPTGSVAHNLSLDAKAFTLLFSRLEAEIGGTVPPGSEKSSCRVTIDLRFPQGWSYTLFNVDYRGFASLDSGVVGQEKSTYWFQATPSKTSTFKMSLMGPYHDAYAKRDSLNIDSGTVWSPCGETRALNIDTEVSVSNASAPLNSGLITIDSMDGELKHVYGLTWMRCY